MVIGSQTPLNGDSRTYISTENGDGCFPLFTPDRPTPLCVSGEDYPGVIRVARLLQADLGCVTGITPELLIAELPPAKEIVLIGTLGHSPIIDRLVQDNKLDVTELSGKWEMFVLQGVENPMPGVEHALVIAGSDKRGTLYGMLDLSIRIGVSPWYWWADVPVQRQPALFVLPGCHTQGQAAVRYRGIFINDEAPALTKWALEKFGGFNHHFYEKVFELILRLKGNYLWPAMWGNAFYDDDPINPQLADEYGIVIGTSHHEPMMRAHLEWARYGTGPWNYPANEQVLRKFWEEGIRGIGACEVVVTLGMRGDGDMPMSTETNIALLEKIVEDQRQIITQVTGKEPGAVPQLWALYKEVQAYYDQGMKAPQDVTLLFSDDNWGNIRRLPKLTDPPRPGGYGIYYHFDYVGDPRNYKWLNTSPISRTWEQMHLVYRYGVDRIWIVNVGDIKPMELPAQFFLDYAWNPDAWPAERLPEYTRCWAEQQFGVKHAGDIASILSEYTRYNGRRKPELLAPDTYSLVNYHEARTIVDDYNRLVDEAGHIYDALPAEYRDAYYQLVLHPVKACANLNELYVTVGRNHLYARQRRAATNDLAERSKYLFDRDAEYSHYYNKELAGGKWNHMMDQTHIGYTTWQQPKENSMPQVQEINIADMAEMGVAIEGSEDWWPQAKNQPVLPEFDCYHQQLRIIEVFNRGKAPFDYEAESGAPWLLITPTQGKVEKECCLSVSVDWQQAPPGTQPTSVTITGPRNSRVVVRAVVHNPLSPKKDQVDGFVEGDGYVSMEAEHYSRAVETESVRWQRIPDLGRTLSAMTPFPVTAPNQTPGGDSPRLEYRMHLFRSGPVKVLAYFSPTLDFHNTHGLRYAISFDDEPPQTINIWADNSNRAWEQAVSDNIRLAISEHKLDGPGAHVLKFWMVDTGVVLQKLVVDTGGLRPSYLGPPECFNRFYFHQC
jgi:hypothetical protein